MRDIFQDLYNKVLGFFNTHEEPADPTKGVALSRLKTVLMQDRVGFSERAIQMMKEELVHVVSKYMEIDDENFQLQIDAQHDKTILELSIPVLRPKSDEEIDEALQAQALKTQKKAEGIVKELENLIKERAMALVEGDIDPELIKEAAKKAEEDEALQAQNKTSVLTEKTNEASEIMAEETETQETDKTNEGEEKPAETASDKVSGDSKHSKKKTQHK